MTGAPIIKKVPGNLVKFDRERDGHVDFKKLSHIELLDLDQREEKLLRNRKFLDKLPDKGEKIKKFYERIQNELKKREEQNNLCGLLANLNVNESKDTIEKLEWTRKYDSESASVQINDETEINPLKILATHSGTSTSRDKQVKQEEEEERIKPSDLDENCQTDFDTVENYAKELCHRFDSARTKESNNKFYTHRTLYAKSIKDLVKNKEPIVISSNSSDITVNKTKMMSLEESLITQQKQLKHLKEVEMRHAMEKLMTKTKFAIGVPEVNVSEYREQMVDSDDETTSIATNEDDDDKDTDVYYNLVD